MSCPVSAFPARASHLERLRRTVALNPPGAHTRSRRVRLYTPALHPATPLPMGVAFHVGRGAVDRDAAAAPIAASANRLTPSAAPPRVALSHPSARRR